MCFLTQLKPSNPKYNTPKVLIMKTLLFFHQHLPKVSDKHLCTVSVKVCIEFFGYTEVCAAGQTPIWG